MPADGNELAATVEAVSAYIEGKFADDYSRVYLSSIGSDLAEQRKKVEELTGLRFGEFVEKQLGYPVGRTGAHNNVLFVVPKGERPEAAESTTLPRFVSSFWTAFSHPIANGEERFINLSNLRFGTDRTTVGTEQDDVRQIGVEFIASDESQKTPTAMVERIDRWLEQQSLERERFLSVPRKHLAIRKTLLAKVISELTPDQLKRTSLPLDVVKSLLSRDD